jgi:hypothetical protein
MKGNHINHMLAEKRASNLSESELSLVQAHVKDCAECLRAYEAAQFSEALLKARASVSIEPSPFFHTRVMAALKERRSETPTIFSLWQIARPIFSAMVASVVLLFILTFTIFNSEQPPEVAQSPTDYSVDALVLEENQPADEDMNFNQVLSAVFDLEDADGKNN